MAACGLSGVEVAVCCHAVCKDVDTLGAPSLLHRPLRVELNLLLAKKLWLKSITSVDPESAHV